MKKKPAPVLPRAQFAEQIAQIEKGDPDEAAQALIKAIPNGETLGAYYAEVLAAVKSISGKINVDPLKAMSTFGSDALRELEETRDRRTAVLWWASLKLWEMPKGDQKQLLVERFYGDLDGLAEAKHIPPESAVKLAWGTLLLSKVKPDVSLDPLIGFLKKYSDSPSPEASKLAFIRLSELFVILEPAAMDDVYRFMKAKVPGRHWPNSAEEYCRFIYKMGKPFGGTISRKDYDELPTLTLEQLYDHLKREGTVWGDGSRCDDFFSHYAIKRIIESYREDPEQVTRIVKSLLDDGLYLYLIEGCVKNPPPRQTPPDPRVIAEYKPLLDLVMSHPRFKQWHTRSEHR